MITNPEEYVSVKEAAKMLGLAYSTVHEYVTEGRIPSMRAFDVILIPREAVLNFKPNIAGRPRTTLPKWRISPEDNTLLMTTIRVPVRAGQHSALLSRFESIRQSGEHLFPGTIARYIIGSETNPHHIEILLIWRKTVMPTEAEREQVLEAFRQTLEDVLDWSSAEYRNDVVFMHT